MRDGASGRSRGFGFLTFKDPKTVNVVMVKEHYLDGKIVSTGLFFCWREVSSTNELQITKDRPQARHTSR